MLDRSTAPDGASFGLSPAAPPGTVRRRARGAVLLALAILLAGTMFAEGGGNAAAIEGTVTDSTGAVVPGATVQIENPVSQLSRTATTDGDGHFSFANVPPNHYHLTVSSQGFITYAEDVEVRSSVPVALKVTLEVGAAAETVNVQGEAGDLVETDSSFHTDVDRQLFDRIPLESS
ncbi:MAG TPA: carboxypeptidase-like regulatory domain-containing protein, partial [Candidatus Methylomirabilis sp.]|nr:carboxypeptidase-like regulatory domain-containing protein [Candidatus Methylomirabilis sp.]